MSISMFLEVEDGARLDEIRQVLHALRAEYDEHASQLAGNLPESNARFSFKLVVPSEPVLTDGVDVDWTVGLLGAFHFGAGEIESAWMEICRFIDGYGAISAFRFVLSFQFENVYVDRLAEQVVFRRMAVE